MRCRLDRYEARYRSLAAELADIGFISPGSLVVRETFCGKPGCRCQADPPPERARGRALPDLDR